jgi:hypothetical protein
MTGAVKSAITAEKVITIALARRDGYLTRKGSAGWRENSMRRGTNLAGGQAEPKGGVQETRSDSAREG